MATFLEEVLAQIQDPEAKAQLSGLKPEVLKVFEDRATVAADLKAKAEKVAASEKDLEELGIYREKAKGWNSFNAWWTAKFGEGADSMKKAEQMFNAVKTMEAENKKLKEDLEKAQLTAEGAETGTIDPDKILSLADERFKGKFVSTDQVASIVKKAVEEATNNFNYVGGPSMVKMIEHSIRAKQEYGLDLPTEVIAEAATKFSGRPDAIEQGYAALTRDARLAKEAKAEADRIADVERRIREAEERGVQRGRAVAESSLTTEDAGSVFGIAPMVSDKPDTKGVDHRSYDPTKGELAKQYIGKYRQLEADGKLRDIVQ